MCPNQIELDKKKIEFEQYNRILVTRLVKFLTLTVN